MTTNTPLDAEQVMAANLQRSMRRTAAYLRAIADKIDQAAVDADPATLPSSRRYSSLAADAQHAVAWGVANASLERLTKEAAEADEARLAKQATS
ncbi:hypothetical protein [Cellulosimicrobium protaetiae]|uniref:Uncharacterized protein n=1 Tax=Cellulosimicrobium protaetiae TaxID=2587808 RepID=A0A6M5UJ26_9MICO|nr:hypothetical protein [Cellulosimicrobium protaetiae]QJW38707.1 hypothetical protein FIC82_020170 [Cellulosimicrobium protaetiae]